MKPNQNTGHDGMATPQEMRGKIRRRAGWQMPYFIPDDKAVVIANRPRFVEFEEPPLEMAISDFEDQIGRKFDGGFWRKVIDWSDKNATFGELGN